MYYKRGYLPLPAAPTRTALLYTPMVNVCGAQQPNFSHFFHHLVKVWLSTYNISMVAVVLMVSVSDTQWTLVGWFGDKAAARRDDAPTDGAFSA